jgi:hypothetical protein
MVDMHPGRPVARSLGRIVAIVLGVVGLALVSAVFVSCVATLDHDSGSIGSSPLQPIAIPAAACPYLRTVNATAERAGEGWFDGTLSDPNTWRPFATQLALKLAVFELALRVAIPKVAQPVATELRKTLAEVRIGRAKLGGAISVRDYMKRTDYAVSGGYLTLSRASDLVGDACGFTLAPEIKVPDGGTTRF